MPNFQKMPDFENNAKFPTKKSQIFNKKCQIFNKKCQIKKKTRPNLKKHLIKKSVNIKNCTQT